EGAVMPRAYRNRPGVCERGERRSNHVDPSGGIDSDGALGRGVLRLAAEEPAQPAALLGGGLAGLVRARADPGDELIHLARVEVHALAAGAVVDRDALVLLLDHALPALRAALLEGCRA